MKIVLVVRVIEYLLCAISQVCDDDNLHCITVLTVVSVPLSSNSPHEPYPWNQRELPIYYPNVQCVPRGAGGAER